MDREEKIDLINLVRDRNATMWVDGDRYLEAMGFSAEATPEISDVSTLSSNGSTGILKGVKCQGKYKVKKRYSRGLKKEVDNLKDGKLTYFDIRFKVEDGLGNEEIVNITDCWLTKHTLAEIEKNKETEIEYPFAFNIDNVTVEREIE